MAPPAPTPREDREFDLLVFGATGFTGRRVAAEAAARLRARGGALVLSNRPSTVDRPGARRVNVCRTYRKAMPARPLSRPLNAPPRQRLHRRQSSFSSPPASAPSPSNSVELPFQ
jgi:hypothetical protein